MIKNIASLTKKDFIEISRSIFFYIIIILWIFISIIMSIYIFSSQKQISLNLIVYKYVAHLTYVSIIFYFIPAIIIPIDFENGMIYIFKNIKMKFHYFFISKIISVFIIYFILTAISIITFLILYTIYNFKTINFEVMLKFLFFLIESYMPFILIFLPVTSLIILISFILLKRSDSAIISSFLFVVSTFFIGTFTLYYQMKAQIGHTSYYKVPYILYIIFLISPSSITGFIAESLKIPDENIVVTHLSNGSTKIGINPPYFYSFLHFYCYLDLIVIVSTIFLISAYLIGKWRFDHE